MLWFRAPEKVYIKKGCLPVALKELKEVMNKKRAFVVTDSFMYKSGFTKHITDRLEEMGITYTVFSDVEPDPSLKSAQMGAEAMRKFEPDCIIAMGGGSAMDAGKIMWVLYEHPDADFRIWQCALSISARECTPSRKWAKRRISSPFPLPRVQARR